MKPPPGVAAAANPVPVLVFTFGHEVYGVPLEGVKEIFPADDLYPVPRAPRPIRGLVDVRGRMVTALDVAALIACDDVPAGNGNLMILVEPRDHLGLWSPAAIDLRTVDLAGLRPRPDGREADPEVFAGFIATPQGLVTLLSVDRLVRACEQEILKRYRAPG
jgi:purine-binding chemotaxis protein CheW